MLVPSALQRFTTIFLFAGTHFCLCDRDFGTVNRLIRRADRIYLPEEYEEMIAASRKKRPFTVSSIGYKDIIDFKNWWSNFYKKTSKSTEKASVNFSVSHYIQFTYNSETPGYVTTSQFIGGFFSHTFKLIKPKVNPHLPSEKAYQEAVPDFRILLPYYFMESGQWWRWIKTCNNF